MDEKTRIFTIWRFFQKLHHNCEKKKAEDFFGKSIDEKEYPEANPDYKKTTEEQKKWSEKYFNKAKRFVPTLRFFPGIRGVAVCNSVALGTAEKNSDIDLFIITDPKRLWTARIFATLYFQILGIRRHGNKVAGRFCLSFFVTEDALDFEKIAMKPKDPYLAFWVSSLVPMFGRRCFVEISKKNRPFVEKNADIHILFQKKSEKIPSGKSIFRNILEMIFRNWFEKMMKNIFLPRTLKKRDSLKDTFGTIVSETILKFHNTDRRKEFLDCLIDHETSIIKN